MKYCKERDRGGGGERGRDRGRGKGGETGGGGERGRGNERGEGERERETIYHVYSPTHSIYIVHVHSIPMTLLFSSLRFIT